MSLRADFTVIGGGILGFSLGNSILDKFPGASVLVLEKENVFGSHASGRNSGVLHAGFYYSPESLKAKFCRDGNLLLRELIKKHNIPIRNTGKVVVARNETEISNLTQLYSRGVENGVKLELLPQSELSNYEPFAKTHKSFLWSPTTAVSDPARVLMAIKEDYSSKGGKSILNVKAVISRDGEITIGNEKVQSGEIINAAGTGALEIAKSLGVGRKYAQLPVLGRYKVTDATNMPLKTLVYPVPNPKNPFLGVHFTLTVDGKVKIGPTAIPVIGREQYELLSGFSRRDLNESSKGILSLFLNAPWNLMRLGLQEYPKLLNSKLIRDGKKIVPLTPSRKDWTGKKPGIRAQLINLESGTFEQDFVVERNGKIVHILNAVSPGWTASIPFAKWIIAENY